MGHVGSPRASARAASPISGPNAPLLRIDWLFDRWREFDAWVAERERARRR